MSFRRAMILFGGKKEKFIYKHSDVTTNSLVVFPSINICIRHEFVCTLSAILLEFFSIRIEQCASSVCLFLYLFNIFGLDMRIEPQIIRNSLQVCKQVFVYQKTNEPSFSHFIVLCRLLSVAIAYRICENRKRIYNRNKKKHDLFHFQ